MDLDLAEYDQVEEIKMLMDSNSRMFCNTAADLLVSLSSCSDQTSLEEHDFVFLPEHHTSLARCRDQTHVAHEALQSEQQLKSLAGKRAYQQSSTSHMSSGAGHAEPAQTGHDPPHNVLCPRTSRLTTQATKEHLDRNWAEYYYWRATGGPANGRKCWEPSKPVGLLHQASQPSHVGNAEKLTNLMQQIVTRPDSILITIPCSYCNHLTSCIPTDISAWLRHMDSQHNSKLCPVCQRLVGLGTGRDIAVMRDHVLDHFDETWLLNQPNRVSFSQGLQQQWFSGQGCSVKELGNK